MKNILSIHCAVCFEFRPPINMYTFNIYAIIQCTYTNFTHLGFSIKFPLTIVSLIFTTRKRSLGQGNVFTLVCLFTEGERLLCDAISCYGQHLPLPLSPVRWKSGRYASYWNAFFYSSDIIIQEPHTSFISHGNEEQRYNFTRGIIGLKMNFLEDKKASYPEF